jgi:hypothetical protein
MALPIVVLALATQCVRLRDATPVYAHAGDAAPVGATRGALRAFVVERGDWYKLRVPQLSDNRPDGLRTTATEVMFMVPRRAVAPAACPPDANLGEIGLISEHLGLRWKDGGQAGWAHATATVEAAAASSDRVTIDGAPYVCFDEPVGPSLTVHVCGSCAVLREASGHVISFGERKEPCAD